MMCLARLRLVCAALGAVLGLAVAGPGMAAQEQPVVVTFLDVGQGDAVVIEAPDGSFAMIDAGRASPLRHLVRLGVDELALLVASHAHADHIGGLDDVLTARPVGSYLDNGVPHSTDTYLELMAHVERLDVRYLEALPRTISLGAVTLEVLPMPRATDDQNNRSVGLLLRYGAFSALLTGDSEYEQLDYWVRTGALDDVVLLKAPHHGSADGFTYSFLDVVRPEVVVVSVGADNPYGLPRAEALAAYSSYAERVARTDRDGHVTVLGYPDGGFDVRVDDAGPDPEALPPEARTVDPTEEPPPGSGVTVSVYAAAAGAWGDDLNEEYAVIENHGREALRIGSWKLCDLTSRCFLFPPDASIPPGRRVVVYSGYGHTDGVSFFMNNDRPVWNVNGDEATLFDAGGKEVARYVYG